MSEHGDVVISVPDPHRAAHTQRYQAVAHEARPLEAFQQLLLAGLHGGVLRVTVQADGVGEGGGHAHPVPHILLVGGRLVLVRHEEEGLDEGDTVELVIEIV